MIVNCHVGAGNGTHSLLCESNKCFQPLSHLSMSIFKRKKFKALLYGSLQWLKEAKMEIMGMWSLFSLMLLYMNIIYNMNICIYIYIILYYIILMYNDCFTFCISMYHMHSTCICQKRGLDLLELELWMVVSPQCECWKVNLVSLQEQQVLLTSDQSLQPSCYLLKSLFLLIWSAKHRSLGLIHSRQIPYSCF